MSEMKSLTLNRSRSLSGVDCDDTRTHGSGHWAAHVRQGFNYGLVTEVMFSSWGMIRVRGANSMHGPLYQVYYESTLKRRGLGIIMIKAQVLHFSPESGLGYWEESSYGYNKEYLRPDPESAQSDHPKAQLVPSEAEAALIAVHHKNRPKVEAASRGGPTRYAFHFHALCIKVITHQ